MNPAHLRPTLIPLITLAIATSAAAQDRPPVKIQTVPVADNIYMLAGAGGNVALSVGDDGLLLIDSAYPQLTDPLLAAVADISKSPIRLLINTHWHFDHVGGNEQLRSAGVTIIAHENVRRRMSSEQFLGGLKRRVPPSPAAARPVLTYTDALTLHWNGDELQVLHVEPAHTDGDSIVYFQKANVLHTGDLYFNPMYPFIDVNAGGSIDGMVAAVDRALTLTNEETKIIPGHGPLSSAAELRAYRDMLATARDHVRALVKEGKSREEVIAAQPTKDLDAKWGRGGFDPGTWVGLVYDGMTTKQ